MAAHDPVRPERLGHAVFGQDEPVAMTIEVVEETWSAIDAADDWSRFEQRIADIRAAGEGYDLGRGRLGFRP